MDGASTELTGVFKLHYRHHEYSLKAMAAEVHSWGAPAIHVYLSFAIIAFLGVFGHRSDDFCLNKFFECW